jgi:two-component sensor histidine kinase
LLTVELNSVRVSHDTAATLGIVIKELLTNAVKHAFPQRSAGRISLRLHADSGGTVLLISDNGRGLVLAVEGHGLRLIRRLVHQLGGEIGHCYDGGTVWRITLDCRR